MTGAWVVHHGDALDVMRTLDAVDHVITDPPYSERTHASQARMVGRRGFNGRLVARRADAETGFGFAAVTGHADVAAEWARLARRWILAFTDAEGLGAWIHALTSAGLDHVRVGAWVREATAPQFSGDRPGVGFEAIEIAHRKGRKRWSGGGLPGVWHAQPAHRTDGPSDHPTAKPLALMLRLVELFTDPGDLVLDPYCGSGTTGVACLRLGRRFVGVERDARHAELARERLAAEAAGLTLTDARAGQLSLLGG